VTFLVDVSAKTGVERKGGGDEKFLERVRNVYLKLAKEEKERFVVLDGRKDQKELVDEVLRVLGPKF
jgi:Thymidylate kinase